MDFGSEVKDDAGYLGEEKEEKGDDPSDDSVREDEKDFEDDRIKGEESEGDIGQELSDDKKESEWDEIDWNEDLQEEREKTEWDDIEWNEDLQEEKEKTEWDEIEWNEDLQEEREKAERDNNDNDSEEQIKEEYIENVESQSTSTVLTSELEELDNNTEHHEQEEEIIEILSEEYQQDTELNVNKEEIEFIEKLEKLAEFGRETTKEGEKIEPQVEKEHAAYYAEEYYAKLKEKGVFNDQDSKPEEDVEQLKQEEVEELKGENESDNSSEELDEDINEASEENMSTEEFEYLWEIRDNLDQEGKSPEEIEEIMHEAEKMYETLKNAEKLYEEQEQEKLKLVDHENEENEEDQKEELDRVDLIEKTAELEEELIQQQKSQEEIDIRVEEAIETIKLDEELEFKIEKEQAELRNIENLENLKKDLDRVDLIEQSVELEEKLVRQGKLQEEIDTRVEEAIEETLEASEFDDITEKLYKEQERKKLRLREVEEEESIGNLAEDSEDLEENVQEEIDVSEILEELSPELDAIERESEDKKDLLRERIKIESEEAEVEEDDRLQELYRQEMGKRPIYSKKKTKGYIQWLEQREIREEKIRNSQTETETKKEIEDEDWKKTIKKWINEASEDECSTELKSEIKKALESYNNFGDLTRKFFELYKKSQHEKLSKEEKSRMTFLLEKLQAFDPIQLEILANIRAIKKYIIEQYGWDSMNRFLDYRIRNKFFGQISQIYRHLKHQKLKLKELKIPNLKLKLTEILQKLCNLIEGTDEQKQFIKSKSMEILDIHIKRAESGEITIPKHANLNLIACTIVYTITVSFENIPLISRRKLADLTNIKTHSYISNYYKRCFSELFPKIDKRKSAEDYRKELELIVREKKGKILGFRRIKGYMEVRLKCECGNTWWTRPVFVSKRGTWCPKDANKAKAEKLRKYDISFCRELAKKTGLSRTGFEGKCLSEEYRNTTSNLEWECGACSHQWSTSLGNILYAETWCSKCVESIGENMCRQFFEALFFADFPKAEKGEFSWLVNDNGNFMELDGHNKNLKIAFERHGRQHYENAYYFYRGKSEEFYKRLRDDQKRKEKCKENGYQLIEVGFVWRNETLHRIKLREMEDIIRKICKEKGIKIPNMEKIKWREFQLNNPSKLKEMQEIARSRAGELLSKIYFNAHTKLHWVHKKCGTDWWATPTQVKGSKNRKGSWCPKCGGTEKKKIEDMQKLAQKILNGGKCLSKRYIDMKNMLNWECGLCEHKFQKSPSNLKRLGYGGCPNCLSIKNMPKSHINMLYYLKLHKNIKSIQDIIADLKYTYNKTVQIKRILERKELIEKYNFYFENSRHGYNISSKGKRTIQLYETLKDEK